VNRLLIVPALAVLLSGCSLAAERDVRAYNACISRHPQDMVVCEAPRQAYEVDLPTFQAKSAAIRPMPDYSYKADSAVFRSSTQACAASSQSCLGDLWSERVSAFPHEAAFRYRSHSSERQQDDHEQTSCGQSWDGLAEQIGQIEMAPRGRCRRGRNGEGLARYCYSQRLLSAAVEAIR
jgi:hypothetical protein